METKSLYELVLNLDSNWRVKETKLNIRAKIIEVYIEYIEKLAASPDSFELLPIYDHRERRCWRHLDTLQYKTYLICDVPRVKDKDGKVKTIQTPWAEELDRVTYLFESHVIDLLQATKNQTQTAMLLDCGFNVVNRIMHRATKRGMSRRTKDLPLYHLSIDEKSFKAGHDYVTVLSHPSSGCVLDVEHGRDKEAVKSLLNRTLTNNQKEKVEQVSMDMWKPYLTVTTEILPKSKIVHDRFHLISYLSTAIDKTRRREVKQHEELRNTRYVLLKNKMNLTDTQRFKFEAIRQANYEVSRAWQVRENFKALFGEGDKANAYILFKQWCHDSTAKAIKEVTKVVTMFENHWEGVVNALVSSLSNAMAERLNGKIQEIKTVGRGYRRFENFRSAILFFHGGLQLHPQHSW